MEFRVVPTGSEKRTIVHLTTVHPRTDARIYLKQIRALAQRDNWTLKFVVADGLGSAMSEGDSAPIAIIDIGKPPGGRLGRVTLGAWRAFWIVQKLRADVVHFHDPELILIGILLKCDGCKVVYDVHEDVPRQVMGKYWLPRMLRLPTAWVMSFIEWIGGKMFDAIVPATPKIAERFPSDKTVVIQNFPILTEMVVADSVPYSQRSPSFAYIGDISERRGAREMLQSLGYLTEVTSAYLAFAGDFSPAGLEDELRTMHSWKAVNSYGYISRPQIAKLLSNVRAGLVLLHPTENYPDAYPVKMFEYMAAGLPVVASDFPLWRKIIESAGCGLLVNPLDPKAIALAMEWLLCHSDVAEIMGRRGRMAVEQIYNWEHESTKLIALYDRLLGESRPQIS